LICAQYGYSGWISMAGTPRTLVELAADGELYAARRDGRNTRYVQDITERHNEAAAVYNALSALGESELETTDILGIPAYYLMSMVLFPPSQFYHLEVPALVLQGKNDFEVFFDRDYEMFKLFLSENPYAEFRIYEGVNHMFMWSTMEEPDIRDYKPPASVELTVMDDIVDWILYR